eukprot:4974747-Pleurochrysis_carterae.AAC.1
MVIRSSQPTTVARKNEMTKPKHQTCMLGPEAQRVVHALCQYFLGFCPGTAGNGSTVAGGNPAVARARLCERVTLELPAGSDGSLRCRTVRDCSGD